MGDMTGPAGEEGGDQKAVQLATAASSVLNAKAGKSSGNDSGAEQERAAVSKYTSFNQFNAIVFCREFIRSFIYHFVHYLECSLPRLLLPCEQILSLELTRESTRD